MSKKNPKRARVKKQKHLGSPFGIMILQKAKRFLQAEKQYWKERNALREAMGESANALALKAGQALPSDMSSTVWGLKDGVGFVRHKTFAGRPAVHFRTLPITLEEWGESGLVVPVEQGEVSLAKAGIAKGLGHLTFINCTINDIHIPYAELSYLKYGDSISAPSIERAMLDFHLTLLGLQAQAEAKQPGQLSGQQTIAELEKIANQFEELLQDQRREEDLQEFLKDHSFVLHQSAECIPKQKLGEDFATDFVLVTMTTQGPTYILVELERASHPVLTKDLTLASPVTHAIKQTRDWDVWLEKNKAYLQNKLPGFETPNYIVVIGRSKDFEEQQKAYMRSYNRQWNNLQLLTYDDVLARFRATIEKLQSTVVK
jgi:hypothetical protein